MDATGHVYDVQTAWYNVPGDEYETWQEEETRNDVRASGTNGTIVCGKTYKTRILTPTIADIILDKVLHW